MSNIKDVAALAGVSVPTVYKAYSNTYFTSPEIREKVYAAAKELGYVPKTVNRTGGKESKRTVALFLDEIVNPFYSAMVRETSKELEHKGYQLAVMYNSNSASVERENFEAAIAHKYDGIIFVPSPEGDGELVKQLNAKRFPMLQLFRTVYPDLDTLLIDDELGTYLAVKHLLQSGHKKIMLISKTNPALVKREVGYARAFAEERLEIDNECLYLMSYADCAKEMIKEKIHAVQPTAILSVGESTSINVIQALSEMNLSIPDDISFIIYDDLPWTAVYGITTVAHSYESIGRLIAEMIDSQFSKRENGSGEQPARLVLDPRLVARKSVKILL